MRPLSLPTTKKSFCIPSKRNGMILRMTPKHSYRYTTCIFPVSSSSRNISNTFAPLVTTSSCLFGPEKLPYTELLISEAWFKVSEYRYIFV